MPSRTIEHGYGPEHRAAREAWRPVVDQGEATCMELVCIMDDRWIEPGTPWDLAHTENRQGYLGPAHAACNRADGGRRSRPPTPPTSTFATSRDW